MTETDGDKTREFCSDSCRQRFADAQLSADERRQKEEEARGAAECDVCGKVKQVECELLLADESANMKRFCSGPCLGAFKFTNTMDTLDCALCPLAFDLRRPHAKVLLAGGKTWNFCSARCANAHVMATRMIVSCAWCNVKKYHYDMVEHWVPAGAKGYNCSVACYRKSKSWNETAAAAAPSASNAMPVIESVSSLASRPAVTASTVHAQTPPQPVPPPPPPRVQIQTQTIRETVKEVMVHAKEPVRMVNKAVSARPEMVTKGVSCKPNLCHKETQTDGPNIPALLPMAVPMFMPLPMQMYQAPYPVPIPVPIPVPVPVFIPTTRNSAQGILKHIKKIQEKIPKDPFEAEMLAMAGALVNGGKYDDDISDDSDCDGDDNGRYTPEAADHQQQLQLGATPAADMENEISGGRVVPKPLPMPTPDPAVSPGPNPRATAMSLQPASTQQRSGQKRRYSNGKK